MSSLFVVIVPTHHPSHPTRYEDQSSQVTIDVESTSSLGFRQKPGLNVLLS